MLTTEADLMWLSGSVPGIAGTWVVECVNSGLHFVFLTVLWFCIPPLLPRQKQRPTQV